MSDGRQIHVGARRIIAFCFIVTFISWSPLKARAQSHTRPRVVTPSPQTTPRPTPTPSGVPVNAPPREQDEEVVRVETDLVNVLFNAVDKDHRFVTTLKQGDVRVFENDAPQSVALFQRETDLPLSLAILIDVSKSQERSLPDEKAAAHIFVDAVIRPDRDKAAIISFTGDATVEQDLTGDVASLQKAIDRVKIVLPVEEQDIIGTGATQEAAEADARAKAAAAEAAANALDAAGDRRLPGSTAIWDALWSTSNEVTAQTPPRTRRAIILLTDGDDTSSQLKLQDAVDAAIKDDTIIYGISIGDPEFKFDDKALRKVTERTGGRAFFPRDGAALNAAFAEIQQELRTQYLIAYSPTNKAHDGSFRRIRIDLVSPELAKQKLKLIYREGYYATGAAMAPVKTDHTRNKHLIKPPVRKKRG